MIDELVDRILQGDDLAVEDLEVLIHGDPAVLELLRPQLVRLIDAPVYMPETLFSGADEDFQREAVRRVDSGEGSGQDLVAILTAIRGPVADEALHRWSMRPPTGADPDGFVRFLRRYGCEFDDRGRRREICGDVAYRLVPEPLNASEDARCPWCSSPLWTALDGGTSDGRSAAALAHTGWKGRLRVVACFFCSTYATVFTQVTPDGAATWSAFTTRPAHLEGRTLTQEDPPAVRLVPGEERQGDYEGHDCEGGSTLGGRPGWVQDPDYPDCPACGKLMDYVGAAAGGDTIGIDHGVLFLFLHAPCGIAAVVSQFD
ncbi:hypothetical protein [Actinomadura welshii]|uniref:hypothetical protein n=1 Tax=Actinomadura welshii TaxID=3103817 RepID=UPI0003AD725C|nr:hypothetical protein [Actinomadura madurae]